MRTPPSVAAALLLLASQLNAQESLRCPGAKVGEEFVSKSQPPVVLPEAGTIDAIWKSLDPAAGGSAGPLGCPTGFATVVVKDAGSDWNGVTQGFQRGWILIGRSEQQNFEAAFVHGLGGWTIWWKGDPNSGYGERLLPWKNETPTVSSSVAPSATWGRGGWIRASRNTKFISLWKCEGNPCSWRRATPEFYQPERPFDFAARLDVATMATPSAARFVDRVNAALPDWLPCFTRLDASDFPGEGELARATVKLRREAVCAIDGRSPRADADGWLASTAFPVGRVPGTDAKDAECPRTGDLDIDTAQLLMLIFRHRDKLSVATVNHLRILLSPWGGAPRASPYVTPPNETCFGFQIIETENHILLQEASRYLINALLSENGPVPSTANRDWLLRFLAPIVRRDMYEYNALPYTRYQMKALLALHDHAPDPEVSTAARGVLHWLMAKEALSGNMDRDMRPYRRLPDSNLFAATDWWGSQATASTMEAGFLVGPIQHGHQDIDLQLDAKMTHDALADLANFPELGTIKEDQLAELIDIADSKYRLPSAIHDWRVARYNDNTANRVTYLQGIRHQSLMAEDPALFNQANDGVEVVSGNRNWTIVAGGEPIGPAIPGDPPRSTVTALLYALIAAALAAALLAIIAVLAGVGTVTVLGSVATVVAAAVGFFVGLFVPTSIASSKQTDKLWENQPAVMRPTLLIPSAGGVSRAQTLRFGQPVIARPNGNPDPRTCVAEGFLCGYDLEMPSHPFNASDLAKCPITPTLPTAITTMLASNPASTQPVVPRLGCLLHREDSVRGWTVWEFEFGTLALREGDAAGGEHIAAAWMDTTFTNKHRSVHVQWKLSGENHDWYNVHAYNSEAHPTDGEAVGGDVDYANSGNVDDTDTWSEGRVTFEWPDYLPDAQRSFIVEACDPTYVTFIFKFKTTHACHANILPRLAVPLSLPPKQAFSCKAKKIGREALVMEVGESCSDSPYGMFVFVWTKGCPANTRTAIAGAGLCPRWASSFGFAVVAPSRGWTVDDFGNMVLNSMFAHRSASGGDYTVAATPQSVDVPISPPVIGDLIPGGHTLWHSTGPPDKHTVRFRWGLAPVTQPNIIDDTGAPSLYGPLASDLVLWPTARGHISAPGVTSFVSDLMTNDGNGCFTLSGLPTLSNPDPRGLVVDMRAVATPVIVEQATSSLKDRCK
ncbi:MAG: hypothetical protein U0132_02210 [Gemmatimonadaceae bacterium]